MSIRSGPKPKLASTAGAYTELSTLPNCARTAEVATMIWDRSGLVVCGPSWYRRPAGIPCDLSTWHMTGSQATMAARLTWPATQPAARLRTAAPAPRAGEPWPTPGPDVLLPDSTSAIKPAATRATTARITPAMRYGLPDRRGRLAVGRAAGSDNAAPAPPPLPGRVPSGSAPRP